jgi:hypothetical protein
MARQGAQAQSWQLGIESPGDFMGADDFKRKRRWVSAKLMHTPKKWGFIFGKMDNYIRWGLLAGPGGWRSGTEQVLVYPPLGQAAVQIRGFKSRNPGDNPGQGDFGRQPKGMDFNILNPTFPGCGRSPAHFYQAVPNGIGSGGLTVQNQNGMAQQGATGYWGWFHRLLGATVSMGRTLDLPVWF